MHAAVDVHANWNRIRDRIRASVGKDVYSSWFERMECECATENHVELSVPTRFLRSWIRSHYLELLTRYWREATSGLVTVDVVVRQAGMGRDVAGAQTSRKVVGSRNAANDGARPMGGAPLRGQSSSARMAGGEAAIKPPTLSELTRSCGAAPLQAGSGTEYGVSSGGIYQSSPLDPNSNFDTFVVGDSNRMAHAAALRVANAESGHPIEFNPLLIYANVGLGKSHLLQAVAHAVRRRDPSRRVLYLTAERFVYGFVSALRQKTAVDFKGGLQATDVLLIDDVQFLQGKAVQREFCHMLNALIDNSRQIMVAADCAAQQLENLDERVRSRLNGGVSVEIGPLNSDQRRQILRNRVLQAVSRYTGFGMPDDVLLFLAEKVVGNGRDLEGAFNRLLAHNQLTGSPITLEIAKRTVNQVMPMREPRRIMIEDIQKMVAGHYNVSRSDLVSSRRTRTVVRPRQIAMYLSKMLTPRSLPEIGRRFGGRDHTTVLHAVRKVERIIGEDNAIKQEVEVLRRRLEE